MNGDGIPDVVRTSTLSSDNSCTSYTRSWPAPRCPTTPDQMGALNVNFTATVVGPISNLASTNAVYQALTEVNVLYPTYSSTGLKNTLFDTTGSSLSNSKYDDEVFYDVPKGTTMQLYSYYLDASNLTTPIAGARINVQFHVDSGYNTSNFIEYSLDGGVTWSNTTIRPLSSDLTARTATFDITSAGGTPTATSPRRQIRREPRQHYPDRPLRLCLGDVDFVATQPSDSSTGYPTSLLPTRRSASWACQRHGGFPDILLSGQRDSLRRADNFPDRYNTEPTRPTPQQLLLHTGHRP